MIQGAIRYTYPYSWWFSTGQSKRSDLIFAFIATTLPESPRFNRVFTFLPKNCMHLRTSTPTDIAERYWKEHASSVNSCLLNAPKVSYYQTAWTSSREVLKSRNETLNYSIPFVLFLKSLYLSVFLFAVSKDFRDFKLLLLLQDRLIQVSQNRGIMKKFFVLFEWFWSKWAFDADGRQYKQAVWQSVKGNCDRLIEVKISD